MPRRMSESQVSMLGRLGAHSMHAKYDSRKTSEAGRQAFLRSFEQQADPEGTLDPAERARRAEHLRKAHFTPAGPAVCSKEAKAVSPGRLGRPLHPTKQLRLFVRQARAFEHITLLLLNISDFQHLRVTWFVLATS